MVRKPTLPSGTSPDPKRTADISVEGPHTSSIQGKDATTYYSTSHHHQALKRKGTSKHFDALEIPNAELISECYIGFSKLLSDELKTFDLKDSAFVGGEGGKISTTLNNPNSKSMKANTNNGGALEISKPI